MKRRIENYIDKGTKQRRKRIKKESKDDRLEWGGGE
jgi:hypothetical protein